MEPFKTNIFHMQAVSGANGLEPVKGSTQVSLDEESTVLDIACSVEVVLCK